MCAPVPRPGAAESRLHLHPPAVASGLDGACLDGAWWPRSRDPSLELPALLAAVAPRLGAVSRIALAPSGWDAGPPALLLAGRVVRLDWTGVADAHSIRLRGAADRCLHLLVIPARVPAGLAAAATELAADAGGASPSDILSSALIRMCAPPATGRPGAGGGRRPAVPTAPAGPAATAGSTGEPAAGRTRTRSSRQREPAGAGPAGPNPPDIVRAEVHSSSPPPAGPRLPARSTGAATRRGSGSAGRSRGRTTAAGPTPG